MKRFARAVFLLAVAALCCAGVASGARKRDETEPQESDYRNTALWHLYDRVAARIDRRRGWDKVPKVIGFLTLVGLRNVLRRENLQDTAKPSLRTPGPGTPPEEGSLKGRSVDGRFNDLDEPAMGKALTPFGRNVPIRHTWPEQEPELLTPDPRLVSRRLLVRDEFVPATSVNVLAATWLQFMVKDWMSHGEGDPDQGWRIPIEADDHWPEKELTILKTKLPDPEPTGDEAAPPAFVNRESPWWDGSQIYGSSEEGAKRRRSHRDGKLVIGDDGLLILPEDPKLNPALVPGWWLGLNMMAAVFIREHNAICDALKKQYADWDDEQLFRVARLANTALIAKIHTIEWTTAIIAHPTTIYGLRATWWGVLGERFRKRVGRVGKGDILSGIPGSEKDHYGVPYSLTEEFGIVYRMHPLIPDDYSIRSAETGETLLEATFEEIAGPAAQDVTRRIPMSDLFYSFATSYPGAIVLHNFPRFLQQFRRPDNGRFMDLAAVDIVRAREFGVPRYNEFRRLLHMEPARSFEELTGGDRALAQEIGEVYNDDIEAVDATVGMFAEPRPEGFAFSDTAFRIFLLMAARRISSDRFLTTDFTKQTYTNVGMDWVQNTNMVDILRRHYPALAPKLEGVSNAFHPWPGTAPPPTAR